MKRTVFLLVASATLVTTTASAASLEIKKGDHISLIGNTLPDRMQHDGWLEAYLHSRFPSHNLVIRNLGFSGDEIPLGPAALRRLRLPRSLAHRHQHRCRLRLLWLQRVLCRRSRRSWLSSSDLDGFLKHTLSQKYNGKTPPRLVLFSPIRHEDIKDRNLPDGSDNNKRLEFYTAAMAEAAKANNVAFVDLFQASGQLYEKTSQPLTINGVHLTEDGNRQLADAIDKTLFADGRDTKHDPEVLGKIRQAVLDKNLHWFNRYRTVDGYSIFGGRADLRFVDGQTNRVVAQREMEVLDVMTANRDKHIWAVAQGSDIKVNDDDTPDFIPVKTNKPGRGPTANTSISMATTPSPG